MKFFKLLILSILISSGVNAMEPVKSKYDFNTTFSNVKNEIRKMNIPFFAEFDHAKNAKDADLELNQTSVIVFGNPKVGTFLMQEAQAASIELPLKIAVWKDFNNNVFVSSSDIKKIAKEYGIKNTKVIDNINSLLQNIVDVASGKK